MSKLFSCDSLTSRRNVEERLIIDTEVSIKKKMMNFDYWGIFNEYIKQNIIMAVLRKVAFIQLTFADKSIM